MLCVVKSVIPNVDVLQAWVLVCEPVDHIALPNMRQHLLGLLSRLDTAWMRLPPEEEVSAVS